jgi:hypothetical protein
MGKELIHKLDDPLYSSSTVFLSVISIFIADQNCIFIRRRQSSQTTISDPHDFGRSSLPQSMHLLLFCYYSFGLFFTSSS